MRAAHHQGYINVLQDLDDLEGHSLSDGGLQLLLQDEGVRAARGHRKLMGGRGCTWMQGRV